MNSSLSLAQRKALGAFYTDESVARFLVGWALHGSGGAVMDPSCGDGRFLDLARTRGASRLVGCDISPEALAATERRLARSPVPVDLTRADFFAVEPGACGPVDAVVGNPPFIRYQRFDPQSRRRALASALRIGVRLTRLTSSWAPFLLHSIQFLRAGGRLAMVVPAEIVQTQYGLRTLRGLLGKFAAVSLVTFEENFFEDAQEGTCLLLAEGYGAACRHVRLIPLGSVAEVVDLGVAELASSAAVEVPLDRDSLARFAEAYLERDERRALAKIKRHPEVRTVAALASVTNGYVTGDNEFFHRSEEGARSQGYPTTWLFAVARSSRSLRGLEFTLDDVAELEEEGPGHHLLVPQDDLFLAVDRSALDRWLAEGERRGTPARFKCRSRDPWWRVPGLQRADVLVGYMAGQYPRAAVNRAGGFFTNSLHGLRLRDGGSATKLALALYSSLSLLSLEIEGRSYGGGILKVEPRELDRVLVPWPDLAAPRLQALAEVVDRHLRAGRFEQASHAVDQLFVVEGLGISARALTALRGARRRLVDRRSGRRRARNA
jgi:adenine-specific DNA-methyltransferase